MPRTLLVALSLTACPKAAPPAPVFEANTARPLPGPLPERPFQVPAREVRTLSNGLDVVVIRNDEVPLVSVRVAFRAGSYAADPPLLASGAFAMLTEGAGALDAAAISRREKQLGATLSAGAGADGAAVSATALRRNLEPTLDLLALVVRQPTFPEKEWSIKQVNYATSIKTARKDPSSIARRVEDRPFYGDAYLGRVSMESDVERLTVADLRAWYASHAGPGAATIFVGGAISADEVLPLLEARFGDWKAAAATPPLPPTAKNPEQSVLYLVDKPGAAQSVVQAMIAVGEPTDADWYPFRVAVDVLGGTFMSRLNLNLREEKGYTYGARCNPGTRHGATVLSCSASVQTAVTGPSLVEMRKELTEILGDRPITDAEVAYMKSTRVNQYPGRLETPSALLAEQESIWRYGLPEDWAERGLDQWRSVERDAAQASLAARLDPARVVWLVVGDKASILADVEAFGVPIVELDADGVALKR